MSTSIKLTAISAVIAAAMASCTDTADYLVTGGEGRVFLSAKVNTDVKVRSRATVDEIRDNAIIWISNSKGVVYEFNGANEIPADGVRLLSDVYTATVWAGDSVPASFTDRYFRGAETFEVKAGSNLSVELTAKIANTVVAVNFDESLEGALKDATMTVGHSQGSLTFDSTNAGERGYFMMNSRDQDLDWTLTGTLSDGSQYTRTGKIESCERATLYNITVRCSETVVEVGGAYFDIVIDDSAIESVEEVQIFMAPVISGIGFDVDKVQQAAAGELGRKSLWITATAGIEGLQLSSPAFESMLGIPGGSFDFIKMEDGAIKQSIFDKGINYVYTYDNEMDQSTIKLNFEETFTNALADGEYNVLIFVTDARGKSSSKTITFNISDDPVKLLPINEADVWATTATIGATFIKGNINDVKLLYREKSASEWVAAEFASNGNLLTANLTELTPGTEYECYVESGDFNTETAGFTTESALQVPNASFEEWSMFGKVVVPGTDMNFWDSGNHGSATMNKNITDKSDTYVHSGTYSAKLVSQFVGMMSIGKFAAGNLFAGNYLRTDGTDGELGWGRPFASRPKAVKAWVRYEPGTVVSGNNKGSGSYMPVGSLDQGIIYAVIVDDHTVTYNENGVNNYKGTQWAAVVKTKTTELFERDPAKNSHIIGLAEKVFEGQPTADGLVEVTIPFEYYRNAKGAYLILVASASRYGDYFQGGEQSTMYVDDIEFVY